MTHRKGEKQLTDRVEKTRKGRFLVIVTPRKVKTVRLPKNVQRMEKRA